MNNFNPLLYILLNPDIKGLTPNNAYKHYMEYGKKENRPIDTNSDFRPEIYLTLNSDLAKYKLSNLDAKLHWLQKGRYQNRIYKPKLLNDIIYLYTDIENKERCISFSNLLDDSGVKYSILENNSNLGTNNLYILFTQKNIVKYPFHYICNFLDYRINMNVLELAMAICINPENLLVPLGRYNNKVYYLKDPNVCDNKLVLRLLVGIDYLDIDRMDISINKDSINVLSNVENREVKDKFTSSSSMPSNINFIYGLKNDIISLKQIIRVSKKSEYPYIIVGKDTVEYSCGYETIYNKIIKYLEKVDNWDVLMGMQQKSINNVSIIEYIQIDKDIELFRTDKLLDIGYCIINKRAYDKILNNLELDVLGTTGFLV
jgi:hypothetical protein